jgi:hypothetical protein
MTVVTVLFFFFFARLADGSKVRTESTFSNHGSLPKSRKRWILVGILHVRERVMREVEKDLSGRE